MDAWAWISRKQAAALLKCSVQTLDRQIRPTLPEGSERGKGPRHRLFAPAVVSAWVAYRAETDKAPDGQQAIEHPDSPALERQRNAQANILEHKFAEMQGDLVHIETLQEALAGAVADFRSVGTNLTRRFGNDAGDLFNDGVEKWREAVTRAIAETQSREDEGDNSNSELDGGVDQGAADQNDPPVRRRRNRPARRSVSRVQVQGE